MKKLTTLLFLFIAALTALAQNGRVEGFVYDSASKEPLDFVSVGLIDASGRTVSACLTDLEGHFEIKADYGSYTLKISNVGYADYSTTVDLSEAHPSQHLRRIALQESATEISEVQVIGQRSAMTLDIDKKVFNVEQSLLSEGANATEVLQNIPTVDVDTEGNVSLRNSSNVEIWINGRPSGLSDSDKADILEMLPAESIKSVELITNPSSKYNPEGSAGIINIVLKEDRTGGYMATVNAGLQYQEGSAYPGGNLGINYTYTSKKWDVNLSANARSNHRENGAFTHRTTFSEGDTTVFNKDNWSDNDRVNGFLRAGFTYHIDSLNDFSVNSFGMYGQHWNNKRMQYQSTIAD
ncbi:MAG: carboxypeptidase-like regulatory domain-containing protein, partial [Paludibacteraceae bacterium]|nr:carboxypeptidase-like regulatory domain-containing protein [Paludibacteraceae bacterium]